MDGIDTICIERNLDNIGNKKKHKKYLFIFLLKKKMNFYMIQKVSLSGMSLVRILILLI